MVMSRICPLFVLVTTPSFYQWIPRINAIDSLLLDLKQNGYYGKASDTYSIKLGKNLLRVLYLSIGKEIELLKKEIKDWRNANRNKKILGY